jgi:hypothetical protein
MFHGEWKLRILFFQCGYIFGFGMKFGAGLEAINGFTSQPW